ncbi:MAG: DNA polymerase III subunit [Beijerinckiaceae bacterium]|nr:MAG: DNA polymerase III subunit [Beijerinckiaceae bacterium]
MIASTSLNALTAVVLDTETTGLDATRARMLQVGAIRLAKGRISEETLVQLVNPGVPIPTETIVVHGITDAMVKEAPSFTQFHPELDRFLGKDVLIGHNIGFDLAILQSECRHAGLRWTERPMLDTRLLAEICLPNFGGYSLDKLAAQFGIHTAHRHDALADARMTAELYLALLPLLRQHDIRTLGTAEQACRQLTSVLENYQRIGWQEPVRPSSSSTEALSRIDAFPFRHRVVDIASCPPVCCPPETTLGDAIAEMARRRISSIFVAAPEQRDAKDIAIITERDVIRLVGEHGSACLEKAAGQVGNRPLETVPADAFVYRAIGRMDRRGIRHLGVTDATGRVIGAISARDLLQLRASDALALGDAIDCAGTIPELAAAWSQLPQVVGRLLIEKVSAREIAAVISEETGTITAHAARLAEAELRENGAGPRPVDYSVLVMGSAGRGESLLIPDQDNAIIHAESIDEAAADAWFLAHGRRMNAILDEIGIPLCKGKVMAGNPGWNGSPSVWNARLRSWTETVDPKDLLAVDIFFDFRCVSGDYGLADDLKARSLAIAAASPLLLKLLGDALRAWSPPLGFLGRLVHEDGWIDLKKGGLFPIVAAARCLALAHGIGARSTAQRLAQLTELGIGNASELAELDRIHALLQRMILNQQIADIGQGRPLSTRIQLSSLSAEEKAELRSVLAVLQTVPDMVHDLILS